ncbi:deoxyguanosinetriphosphate triphosphohydrolase [Dethiobacter alkaliphilus]|uniref:Deoxyguanosinetriphosphate triphosphohydrolase-like protein n=1 Tax=Dethiobacter alkaliphilus AHT 1 TaxID=555088 RepID=C0GBZ5_DETAL|nr:deoxyguanosinetriphosphate triphosphohydrolase [Dethiobacter alkaliphilus]EEG78730.1 deoxyguanosinetriphosphate triphosphohydrolase [Dethiobacter alkaliphilus AHT 1]
MLLRKEAEAWEEKLLCPGAARSNDAGRARPEAECDVRTAFQRDRDRIIHSKAFRRLKHKTQVFIAPEGDHYRTRLTHTLEVCQIARTVARALKLNEDLTEAIALGHDLGHTPFGHAGEDILDATHAGGFKHNEQSLRVVDVLERDKGLNLTEQVRDGILHHTGPFVPATLEGQLVKICDRVAYINHDIDDALRAGILNFSDMPVAEIRILGENSSVRINRMVKAMIENSWQKEAITIGEEMTEAMNSLRDFMFRCVYIGSNAKREEHRARHVIESVYNYLLAEPDFLPEDSKRRIESEGLPQTVCDYVAGMTDRYILARYHEFFLPKPWKSA